MIVVSRVIVSGSEYVPGCTSITTLQTFRESELARAHAIVGDVVDALGSLGPTVKLAVPAHGPVGRVIRFRFGVATGSGLRSGRVAGIEGT